MSSIKLLILSRTFLPVVGGMEIAIDLLASQWRALGLEVKLVTKTPGDDQTHAYEVIRRPSVARMIRLVHQADVVYSRNVSLRGLWPLALVRRPWVVSHHSWYTRTNGEVALADRLKRTVLRRADVSIAVSSAIARPLGPETIVMPNPFRDALFHPRPDVAVDRDLVFVGRMVSDKGIDVLLRAMATLASRGQRPSLSLVGDGPEVPKTREIVEDLRLSSHVAFVGTLRDEALAREIARHRVMVVPSRYEEPFGIVAVEGIASGCVVIGSQGGGLPEAIGPCGLLFPNGDATALAHQIERVLQNPALAAEIRSRAPGHIERFRARNVARRYVEIFSRLAERQR
jgi:glycosyltransferase involved in cell wall biosynthesis